MPFDTLLVANRGEIAVRIIKTARSMGLRTVAVYSDADAGAAHTHLADDAVRIGPAPATASYLRGDAIVEAALAAGAGAIHPGYGFLSENAGFARATEAAGIAFVGPTPAQLEVFGAKHTAREAAAAVGVPMLAGTGLLATLDEAVAAAERIGYPVMLKATAGGGGVGLRACHGPDDLAVGWQNVRRVAGASFGSTGVFLERLVTAARHVEVQLFGDGLGHVVTLGDRDCSLQRRHQKVCEEAPAPNLPDALRRRIADAGRDLAASVAYRSAGTVEYLYDAEREEAAFLEVNTRLQVEHPVTEAVYRIDLVEWMLRLAQGDTDVVRTPVEPRGHAVEARIYAENPDRDHLPSAGTITAFAAPDGVRVDTWLEAGAQVSTHYDPMLAKVITAGPDRTAAWAHLATALAATRVDGVTTNLGLLRTIAASPEVRAVTHSTATVAGLRDATPRFEVLRPGLLTTIQDWPGRTGYWHVGIPPSGPMDDLSFRLGNLALGNPEGAPGLECTLAGPALRFAGAATVMVTGAPVEVTVNGTRAHQWEPVQVPADGVLDIGAPDTGMRTYVLVRGGIDAPRVLGSAATFDLGEIGGMTGSPLRTGDVVPLGPPPARAMSTHLPRAVHATDRPTFTEEWRIGALEGPHAAPEFFTSGDVTELYAASWQVHFNSARTGVRLVGPKPTWARPDGGEAGLHPSNIHDTPYAVGAVDYTGDIPILLGPDGPSLGGFTCPATVAVGQLWKLGQLRPGATVRFVPIDDAQAAELRARPQRAPRASRPALLDGGVLARRAPTAGATGSLDPEVTYRRSGDDNLLIEYGSMSLDLAARMRVHALAERIVAEGRAGIVDLTPGIRSLQVHLDPDVLPVATMFDLVRELEDDLPATADLVVPSRTVHLPLSWDDPATREAIERYMNGVRDDAPWCPWNIEFIRRANGLATVDDVYRTVFDAEYLVMGLGDVYLGAPVATPVDPRHRLVTTKYNPARTWTPQNAVGIGGSYLCIYGMEGPGGYQFVGRTVQVWSTHSQRGAFEPGTPWLLRPFDRISWHPVGADELLDQRASMAAGRLDIQIDDGEFAICAHDRFLAENAASIASFRADQATAFGAERDAWAAAGEFDPRPEPEPAPPAPAVEIPAGCSGIEAPFVATVFRVDVRPGDVVVAGQVLVALEAMKMEAPVVAPQSGTVIQIVVTPGDQVGPGEVLVVLEQRAAA
ncbi:urea carboxylase [Pengzhenrongella sp.]|uniref:urea carboxylase n=1 Tax=Pengzhenrongella sp. TaxID=2888820 RepID=UPI002F94CADD